MKDLSWLKWSGVTSQVDGRVRVDFVPLHNSVLAAGSRYWQRESAPLQQENIQKDPYYGM